LPDPAPLLTPAPEKSAALPHTASVLDALQAHFTPLKTPERATYLPWSDGRAIGFECRHGTRKARRRRRDHAYLYLLPTQEGTVRVHNGPHGDPTRDHFEVYSLAPMNIPRNQRHPASEPGSVLAALRATNALIETPAGVTHHPWSDGWAIGFETRHPDGQVEFVYLNPSGESDDGTPNIFVYRGPYGDASYDRPEVHYNVFDYLP
jgi:hypothetical protein